MGLTNTPSDLLPGTLELLILKTLVSGARPLLFQVEARDPMTFSGTAAVLAAVGVLAAWVPARRAARLDPATVLRES